MTPRDTGDRGEGSAAEADLPPDGLVVPVDKPTGPTSHDMVARVRRVLGRRRVGHTGTLDPFASGLLLLTVGPATRISQYLTDLPKVYEAEARLGVRTTTHDPEGEVVGEAVTPSEVDEGQLQRVLQGLRGTVRQVPPAFSAKKVGGEPAHRRVRRGEAVELDPVPVTIHDLQVLGVDPPHLRFRVTCSSGTYVRALARDLGEGLGFGAHLVSLRRTAVGDFGVEDAVAGEALQLREIRAAGIPPVRALGHLPAMEVDEGEVGRLAHGQRVRREGPLPSGPVVLWRDGILVAVAEARDGSLQPRKVFA